MSSAPPAERGGVMSSVDGLQHCVLKKSALPTKGREKFVLFHGWNQRLSPLPISVEELYALFAERLEREWREKGLLRDYIGGPGS